MHGREHAIEPERGIVDETEQRAEFVAHAFHEIRNVLDLAKIEGDKVQRTAFAALCLGNCRGQLFIRLARHGDNAIARRDKIARDAKPETAAGARDQNIARRPGGGFLSHFFSHDAAPACRSPRRRVKAQC